MENTNEKAKVKEPRGFMGVRLSLEERGILEKAVHKEGHTISSFLRHVGIKEARKILAET